MKSEYDLSAMKSRPNPYAARLRQQVTIQLRRDTLQYFKELADETGVDYRTLIDLSLADCAEKRRRPAIAQDSET
jgi:hypothetical protein